MSIWSMLYSLLIKPLEILFEVVFSLANRVIDNPNLAIIFLSLAMNILVLPLYRRADLLQANERDRSQQMKPFVDHIRKVFDGDEQMMILQTYYKQQNYKYTDSLNGIVPLLLEIPFFIAGYRFLSGLNLLRGCSFGPIHDMGAPDQLLSIGSITINVLPILMTLINVISSAIYLKGFPLKSKLQTYGTALIFLVLLYNSPAGLVFYWTLNNLFSLAKNIFYKIKNAKIILSIMAALAGVGCAGYVLHKYGMSDRKYLIFSAAALLICFVPLVLCFAPNKLKKSINNVKVPGGGVFLFGSLSLAILTGLLIPSAIINASPAEFVDISAYKSPVWYIVSSSLLALGTFVVWLGIFYKLASSSGKYFISLSVWLISVVAIINYMFFGTRYGNLSDTLKFDVTPAISHREMLINLGVILVAAVLLYLIWKVKPSVVKVVCAAMCLAVVCMGTINIFGINKELDSIEKTISAANSSDDEPHFSLSKDGQNVVVIMMDRATATYVPSILNEKPELKEKFDGFTFYRKAISYGTATNAGAPALYGGYEYTPENMNERSDVSLGTKMNEALRVMPVLFDENDYNVTVFDPTYAGYSWIPDLSIYDDYPDINKYITMGRFKMDEYSYITSSELNETLRMRNFFCYSIFKISPLLIQPTLYDGGRYNTADRFFEGRSVDGAKFVVQTYDGLSKSSGIDESFMDSYAVLDKLPSIGQIIDDDSNNFLMMSNDLTHNPALLSEPDYLPAWTVDNTEYDKDNLVRYAEDGSYVNLDDQTRMTLYHANMAALLKLGEWFDYLRENDVYDNTRIIIVSDHGWSLWQRPEMILDINKDKNGNPSLWDLSMFNCLLLVKDFNSEGFSVDDRFMTNADTPVLAMDGLISNPRNPSTGKTIDSKEKEKPEQHLMYPMNWQISENNGNVYLPDHWFSVHDDIYDSDNWSYLGVH